jgi:hypothetical protein
MGFEYKIKVSLSNGYKEELDQLLKSRKDTKNNFSPEIEINEDGIYVCEYTKPNVWQNLDFLHQFLLDHHLDFEVIEL